MWKWLSMVLIWASKILCRVKLFASLKSQTLRFTVEFLSIKYVRIWKIDGFVLIKPILYKSVLTNTSYVIFLLVFDNPCKTSVLYLALFRGRRAIRTRILLLILSHNNVILLTVDPKNCSPINSNAYWKKILLFLSRELVI